MNGTKQIDKLWDHVVRLHGDQKRKYTGEPYTVHLEAVRKLVENEQYYHLIQEVAICHDLIEDTECTSDVLTEILIDCGYLSGDVAQLVNRVVDLTDKYTHQAYKELNRGKRKILEAERLCRIHPLSMTVKYADLIDNTKSIVEHDKNFAEVYLREKEYILDKMTLGSQPLRIRCIKTLQDAKDKLTSEGTQNKR